MSNKKLIIRLKGGLGNQLFIYAFGYSLAKKNSYNLLLDYLSGFARDYEYKRFYLLNNFQLTGELASKKEMLFPFERLKRGLLKFHNFFLSNNKKYYLTEKNYEETDRIKFSYDKIYFDGLWQKKSYFNKFSKEILNEFQIKDHISKKFKKSSYYSKIINDPESVFLHLRDFNNGSKISDENININYYLKAIDLIKSKIRDPKFYVFCENSTYSKNFFDNDIITANKLNINHVIDKEFQKDPLFDFWLMQNCKNSIIANSTFSWWAAWLGNIKNSGIVIYPNEDLNIKINNTNISSTIYNNWYPISLKK